jgi:hypothetical protein
LPEELKTPVGIADDLCDGGSSGSGSALGGTRVSSGSDGNDGHGEGKKEGEKESAKRKREESGSLSSLRNGEDTPKTTVRVCVLCVLAFKFNYMTRDELIGLRF